MQGDPRHGRGRGHISEVYVGSEYMGEVALSDIPLRVVHVPPRFIGWGRGGNVVGS